MLEDLFHLREILCCARAIVLILSCDSTVEGLIVSCRCGRESCAAGNKSSSEKRIQKRYRRVLGELNSIYTAGSMDDKGHEQSLSIFFPRARQMISTGL